MTGRVRDWVTEAYGAARSCGKRVRRKEEAASGYAGLWEWSERFTGRR